MKKIAVSGILSALMSVIIVFSVCPIDASAVDGRSLSEYYGFSYESYMDYLYSHENDNYYLGTPYRSGNWRSPNGDTSYNGSAGMNCSGFVWHVLKSCILRSGGDPSDYQILSFSTPRGWYGVLEDNGIEYYIFNNKYEALASGVMSKGDIIMMFCNAELYPSGQNHIGIYWGDGSSDVFWHSAGRANYISHIRSGGAVVKFVVAKMRPRSGNLTVKLTDSDSAALSGGEFCVYSSSGAFCGSVKSGESLRLNYGTYTVSQTKTPDGYDTDSRKQTVDISSSNPNRVVTFINNKKRGAASVSAKVIRYIPSLASYAEFTYSGIEFDVYSDGDCLKKIGSAQTGPDGVAVYGLDSGKYTLDEGSECYFKLSENNKSNFKNYIFDYNEVFGAKIVSDLVTAATDGGKTYSEISAFGAIKIKSEPGEMFRIYNDDDDESMCFTACSDLFCNSVYGINMAYADGNGDAFFGLSDRDSGCVGYLMNEGGYTIVSEDDSSVIVCVKSGCVTDGLSGECTLEMLRGDADLSGDVSIADARVLLRCAARLDIAFEEQISACDFDSDSKITVNDARTLLRYCAKLEPEL